MKSRVFRNISDTAYLVAAYRALESERPDALFKDPLARRLAGSQGERILDELKDGRRSGWFLVARTCILDPWILEIIQKEQIDTVINLAAGLDTRAFRLPLPPQLKWFDIDLPELSSHKETLLENETPRCRYQIVKMDLANRTERALFFSSVARGSQKTLILSEGFLMYLKPEQVSELATELAGYAPFQFWLAELIGPFQLKLIQLKWGKAFQKANSQMFFGPIEGAHFFQPLGWNLVDFRSSFDKAIQIGRAPRGAKLLRQLFKALPFQIGAKLNQAGIALLRKK